MKTKCLQIVNKLLVAIRFVRICCNLVTYGCGSFTQQKRAIEADVSIDDIERSHRVGKPRSFGRPRDMIVKFVSYRVRRRVYGARTKTKDKGYRGVYINEDLTKPRSKLLLKARKMVKLGQLASAWSSDGTILVRDLRDTKHRIASDSDLAVFGPVPVIADQANNQAGSGSLELPSPNVTEMTL